MEHLPALGTAIGSIIPKTMAIYLPLLQSQSTTIQSSPCTTFCYGSHPRQELDICSPSKPLTSSSGRPHALIFLHGGGLVRGAKNLTPLIYANLGHYFASHGIITIIPNYRLIEHGAKYPSGGEDITLVLEWMHHNLQDLGEAAHSHGVELAMMGNSAGGLHLATYLLGEHFGESRHVVLGHSAKRKIWLEKVVFLATPFDMQDALPERKETNDSYFGERVVEDSPLGLLERAEKPFEGLKVLVLTGSLDPKDEILDPNERFVAECKGKAGLEERLKVEVMEGHNHISPVLALGTGVEKEEAWGEDVVKFINE